MYANPLCKVGYRARIQLAILNEEQFEYMVAILAESAMHKIIILLDSICCIYINIFVTNQLMFQNIYKMVAIL
jgi:hypothetical protein